MEEIMEPMDCSENVSIASSWNHLPVELKRSIITNLSFPDKQNMMLVNWECSEICQTLPNKLNEICIVELPSTAKTALTFKWKSDQGKLYSKYVEYRGLTMRQADCPDYTKEAMKAFLKILRRSKIKFITIEIPCFEGLTQTWNEQLSDVCDFSVRHITIRTNDYRLIEKVMTSVRNSRHEISLLTNDHGGVETCVFDLEKVKQARSVILWSLISNIQDYQFLSLRAHNIRVASMYITSSAIAHVIKEWRNGDRKLERLHISSPLINMEEIVREIESVCWKELTDICQVIWREVDEEGYSYATRGPMVHTPAAIGLIYSDGVPTFIFRIIKMTDAMSQLLSSRCAGKGDCKNMENRIEQTAH